MSNSSSARFTYALLLSLTVGIFAQPSAARSAPNCSQLFKDFTLSEQEVLNANAFLKAQPQLTLGTKEFVESRVFSRLVQSEEVGRMSDYIANQTPGTYLRQTSDWVQELPRGTSGRTKMPPLITENGEFQAGLQIIDRKLYVILKGIRVFGEDGKPLRSGERTRGPSTYFTKAMVAALVATSKLARNRSDYDSIVITTIASVNGNIGRVLGEKLGLKYKATIPKDEWAAKIDDRANAIAKGADPDRLTIMDPRDYFIELVL